MEKSPETKKEKRCRRKKKNTSALIGKISPA